MNSWHITLLELRALEVSEGGNSRTIPWPPPLDIVRWLDFKEERLSLFQMVISEWEKGGEMPSENLLPKR
ncbi:hypothetical protein [Microbulbifer epialgicus]|uniref:Uncharacterized protein n=1 Tax=Microbulbifer epialgicus TaxID=393907 RepID=A0ABV4P369_9GAMM